MDRCSTSTQALLTSHSRKTKCTTAIWECCTDAFKSSKQFWPSNHIISQQWIFWHVQLEIHLSNQSFSRTTIAGGYTYVFTIQIYTYIWDPSYFPSPISSLDCLHPKGRHLHCKQLHYAWSQQIPLLQEKSICYILSTWLTSVHHRLNFDPLKLMANVKTRNNSYSRWLVSTQAKKYAGQIGSFSPWAKIS